MRWALEACHEKALWGTKMAVYFTTSYVILQLGLEPRCAALLPLLPQGIRVVCSRWKPNIVNWHHILVSPTAWARCAAHYMPFPILLGTSGALALCSTAAYRGKDDVYNVPPVAALVAGLFAARSRPSLPSLRPTKGRCG